MGVRAPRFACETTAIEQIAESCGNDIRQVINQLQLMFKTVANKQLSYSQVSGKRSAGRGSSGVSAQFWGVQEIGAMGGRGP